ncbi:PREDICTED: L10-interacting MYB domain-containing protein-like [Camelina sativa]|uniref:L10-interacting MYB domain-containing protein-like n=1 Tax=Camelina sativa TaxID=90675 RepID=A0ABM0TU17_CAMSA|nr:PREDICTED: L10-interacting MYB domain-containing protein-like [Camelina sativa]
MNETSFIELLPLKHLIVVACFFEFKRHKEKIMTSIPGTDFDYLFALLVVEVSLSLVTGQNLIWSDEETRLYLELRLEENLKGNIRKHIVNEVGRQTIISKFYDTFGEKHTWIKFRNKFNTCKKQYSGFKKLTHRTGMSYHPNGSIDMSDDWWDERYKEWPGARKIKDKPMPNADLMEQMLGSIHITGAEGWSAQQGESHLDNNMMLDEDEAASEST